MSPSSIDVEFLIRFKTSTYIPVSSASLLAYDFLLTFADEIRYVWGSKWSVGKALYLLARYPLLFNLIVQLHRNAGHDVSDSECHTLFALTGYMYLFGVLAAEAILVLRVWALWQRSKRIAVTLAVMTVAGLAIGLTAVFKLEGGQFFVPRGTVVSLSYPGCIGVADSNNSTLASYVVLMVYELGIFLLMVINGIKGHLRVPTSSMMYVFYKDGFLYFASLLGISVINLVIILTQPPEFTNLLISTQAALHSMLSTRILLNLRHRSESMRGSTNTFTGSLDLSGLHRAANGAATVSASSIRFQHSGREWFGHGSQSVARNNDDDETELVRFRRT
ncbi:hypothetical protein PC9H_005491 [Pleurotus ostreatus]|uniref:DUF6533 domain-containing protein n=1 Tax=Pleurotus ostreatus TaxID=5322 RepID=A0A8H7A004_PLEOS|nr:uncharacterized protein PC9H_005491 [Pleurotus ostreatus]KAF7433534.1 hypothetical protein PC9H_005491 [Pleurotus ostreatus]KAJ8697747.1 hypothetical protein PTI98_004520 [Pleurotus ostreatus]